MKCGTLAGYRIHTRKNKELPCEACREAMKDHWKNQRIVRNDPINEKRRAWRARTPGANRGRTKRARLFGGEEGLYSDTQVLEVYGTDCHICNLPIDLTAPRQCGKEGWEKGLQIDHLFPLSKGGSDTLDNVRPAHGYCNNIKSATVDYKDKMSNLFLNGE
jgi:5-methylcytosine-specific restriction endonuclease McrA